MLYYLISMGRNILNIKVKVLGHWSSFHVFSNELDSLKWEFVAWSRCGKFFLPVKQFIYKCCFNPILYLSQFHTHHRTCECVNLGQMLRSPGLLRPGPDWAHLTSLDCDGERSLTRVGGRGGHEESVLIGNMSRVLHLMTSETRDQLSQGDSTGPRQSHYTVRPVYDKDRIWRNLIGCAKKYNGIKMIV